MVTSTQNYLHENYLLKGEKRLLYQEPVLILNSRQSKTPVGTDPWVRNTIDAVKFAADSGSPVIASIGMNTWELVLWAVGEFDSSVIILCPLKKSESADDIASAIADDFELGGNKHVFVFIPEIKSSRGEKTWWRQRDLMAFELAGSIIPVSVNPLGGLASLIDKEFRDKIDHKSDFRTEYKTRHSSGLKIDVPDVCRTFDNWHYLTHWTKRTYEPWPGEKSSDFYRAIASSGDIYPRLAIDTLSRILQEGLIRGSTDHIRGGNRVTAFTALPPQEAIPLMKWRKRFVKPTFEPYGIAINYRSAFRNGIRPVTYVSASEKTPDSPEFFQGFGTGDWPKEKEWRALGDVVLSDILDDELIVLVPDPASAEKIRPLTRFRIESLSECG